MHRVLGLLTSTEREEKQRKGMKIGKGEKGSILKMGFCASPHQHTVEEGGCLDSVGVEGRNHGVPLQCGAVD